MQPKPSLCENNSVFNTKQAHAQAQTLTHTNLEGVAGGMPVVYVHNCAWQNHIALEQEMRFFSGRGKGGGWGVWLSVHNMCVEGIVINPPQKLSSLILQSLTQN